MIEFFYYLQIKLFVPLLMDQIPKQRFQVFLIDMTFVVNVQFFFEEFGIYTYSNISSKQLSANITYSIDDPTANEWSLNKILIDEGNVHDSLLCALSFTQSLIKRLCIIEDNFRIVVGYNPPEPEDVFDGIDCTVSFYKIRPELPDIYDQDIESYSQALFFCDICCDV